MSKIKSLDKTNIRLGFYIILLQICDIIITLLGLNKGATEGNPLVIFFMEQFGILGGLLVIKSIVVIIICSCIIYNKHIILVRTCFFIVIPIYLIGIIIFAVNHIINVIL